MANGRNPSRRRDTSRDPGGFVALPWSVLDSPAYLDLSHPAKALLLELARQYRGGDNGRLLLSDKHLSPRGWNSPSVVMRAKRELLDAELIFETVKGSRPNRASWFALTWRELDRIPGYDSGVAQAFERGAYRKKAPSKQRSKNESLTTSPIVVAPSIATAPVVEVQATTIAEIAIPATFASAPTTSPVVPLEVAIFRATVEGPKVRVGVGQKVNGPSQLLAPKSRSCQQPGCLTITLGREFCVRHRAPANPPGPNIHNGRSVEGGATVH